MDGRCHRKRSFKQMGVRPLAKGRGGCMKVSSAEGGGGVLEAGATGESRKWYLGGILGGGGGSPALRTRTGQGTPCRP